MGNPHWAWEKYFRPPSFYNAPPYYIHGRRDYSIPRPQVQKEWLGLPPPFNH